jgi:hypothetical protein
MFGLFGGLAGGSFQAHYRCYPVSFMDKPEAETGNKIFLPSSALDRLGANCIILLKLKACYMADDHLCVATITQQRSFSASNIFFI